MNHILSPLVGWQMRPLGKMILSYLPADCPLILDPEPLNEWDSDAIKVSVALRAVNVSADHAAQIINNLKHHYLPATMPDGIIQLGYIARTGRPTCKIGLNIYPGNAAFLPIIQSGPNWEATLTFASTGAPLVKLQETSSHE